MSNELIPSEDSGTANQNSGAVSEGLAGSVARYGALASASGAPASRKAEIEHIRDTDFDAYDSNPTLQREYRAILEAEIAMANPDKVQAIAPMLADNSRDQLVTFEEGAKLVQDWDRIGGFGPVLSGVQKTVMDAMNGMGRDREQRVFAEKFDRQVPLTAQVACYREIARGADMFAEPVSDAEVRLFASMGAGRALVSEWGSYAGEKVAVIRARIRRLMESMDEADAEDFGDWLDNLDDHEAKALFRSIAA